MTQRDIAKDKEKIEVYFEMDYIEDGADIAAILDIACHYINKYEAAQARISELETHIERIERKGYV